jgi:hypothetical protein
VRRQGFEPHTGFFRTRSGLQFIDDALVQSGRVDPAGGAAQTRRSLGARKTFGVLDCGVPGRHDKPVLMLDFARNTWLRTQSDSSISPPGYPVW